MFDRVLSKPFEIDDLLRTAKREPSARSVRARDRRAKDDARAVQALAACTKSLSPICTSCCIGRERGVKPIHIACPRWGLIDAVHLLPVDWFIVALLLWSCVS